ncbi:MAG: threonine synthase [Pseudomonadota bacterium]
MHYLSTRGQAPRADFDDVLTQALAADGGLFVPEHYPSGLTAAPEMSFADVAARVLAAFGGDAFPLAEAQPLAEQAFGTFRHEAAAPVIQLGDDRVLELFHGPTLAFKDVAMQLLARLFERSLARSGRTMQVVVATSGDTGGAAVASLANRAGIKLCVLHPHERISEVQRRFMTTTGAENVLNLAVDGTFDDCQTIVKALFADRPFAESVSLGGVNSINWARIASQVTYYLTACRDVGEGPVHFSVPTGNFGDVFAGWVAKKMGAPIGQLIVAVNENDILDRALRTGVYDKRGVTQTSSPSMDIEIASNFERAIFEASGRDSALTASLMAELKAEGTFTLPENVLTELRKDFLSYRASQAEVAALLKTVAKDTGILIDPHTAIGIHAARRGREEGLEGPIVTLATAHAAKFPDAVEEATGQRPALPFPEGDLYAAEEIFQRMPATTAAVQAAIKGC